jgi:hypothetical protein
MGTARSSVHALLQNKWYSLTELTDFTNGLARIPVATGRDQVVSLAATASSEEEARSLLLTGKLSPRAREELTALGWKIRVGVVPWQ